MIKFTQKLMRVIVLNSTCRFLNIKNLSKSWLPLNLKTFGGTVLVCNERRLLRNHIYIYIQTSKAKLSYRKKDQLRLSHRHTH